MPTMLVDKTSPIVESDVIMSHMDREFEGKVKLQKELEENDRFKDRYEMFYNLNVHDWQPDSLTFGTIMQSRIVSKIIPIRFNQIINRIKALQNKYGWDPSLNSIYEMNLIEKKD